MRKPLHAFPLEDNVTVDELDEWLSRLDARLQKVYFGKPQDATAHLLRL